MYIDNMRAPTLALCCWSRVRSCASVSIPPNFAAPLLHPIIHISIQMVC